MSWFKLLLLIVAAVVAAQITNRAFFDQVALAFLAFGLLAFAWSWFSLRGVGIIRETVRDRSQVGQPVSESIRVFNRSLLPKLWVEVRDYSTLIGHNASRVVNLSANGGATWSVESVCRRRGRYRLGPMSLHSGDPFGVFPRRVLVRGTHELIVYPAIVDVSGFAVPSGTMMLGTLDRRRSPFVTPSVSNLRDYLPGDPLNRISWKHTARVGHLIVREFDSDPTSDLWIVLDLDEAQHARSTAPPAEMVPGQPILDSTEEYSVTIAASLAVHFVNRGRSVGLVATATHHEAIAAERSDRQSTKILEALAVIRADGETPLAEALMADRHRFQRHATVIVITPSIESAWLESLIEVNGRRMRSTAIVVDRSSLAGGPGTESIVEAARASGIPAVSIGASENISRSLAGTETARPAGLGMRYG